MILLEQIINNNKPSDMLKLEFQALKQLANVPDDIVNKFDSYLTFKLEKYFAPYLKYEVIYEIDICVNNLLNITSKYANDLWRWINLQYLLLDNSFTDFENIGSMISELEQSTGYGGFNINNQDGDFQKSKSLSKNNANRIQYLNLLIIKIDDILNRLVNESIQTICRLIY